MSALGVQRQLLPMWQVAGGRWQNDIAIHGLCEPIHKYASMYIIHVSKHFYASTCVSVFMCMYVCAHVINVLYFIIPLSYHPFHALPTLATSNEPYTCFFACQYKRKNVLVYVFVAWMQTTQRAAGGKNFKKIYENWRELINKNKALILRSKEEQQKALSTFSLEYLQQPFFLKTTPNPTLACTCLLMLHLSPLTSIFIYAEAHLSGDDKNCCRMQHRRRRSHHVATATQFNAPTSLTDAAHATPNKWALMLLPYLLWRTSACLSMRQRQ